MKSSLAILGAALATTSSVSADWSILTADVGTICTGVAFVDANTGYLPVAANGVGTELLRTSDAGKTWTPAQDEPFALLLLDIAAYDKNVAVIGALTMEYSINGGVDFNSSLAALGAGQCIRTIGPDDQAIGFGAVGQFGLFSESNGALISFDAGITYSTVNVTDMVASARYGAFPTDTTWYIAAGDWPGEGADDDTCDDPPCAFLRRKNLFAKMGDVVYPEHYVNVVEEGSTLMKMQSSRVHLVKSPKGVHQWAFVKKEAFSSALTGQPGFGNATTWDAQIAKTTDGGKTWDIVYSQLDSQYYFNGVECATDSQCCVVAENGDSTDPSAGTYIFCTSDAGATWTETYIDDDPESSLTDIGYLSATEFWATGGEFAWYGFAHPQFHHTVDGGKTWTSTNGTAAMADQYAIAIDCVVSSQNCYANLLDVLTQESSLAVLNAPA